MTTEEIQFITQQIRIKYYGQNVFVPTMSDGTPLKHILKVSGNTIHLNSDGYLQLRSIEALTDDEFKAIHKILKVNDNEGGFDCTWQNLKKEMINYGIDGLLLFDFYGYIIEVYQYILQIGLALPHYIILPNGETLTADVSWQVEQGIIKITK